MLKVVIAGCTGRMGHALLEGVIADDGLVLHAALDRVGSPLIGHDAGEPLGKTTGVQVSHDIASALQGANVLIDFTRPEASLQYLAACRQAGVGIVTARRASAPSRKSRSRQRHATSA